MTEKGNTVSMVCDTTKEVRLQKMIISYTNVIDIMKTKNKTFATFWKINMYLLKRDRPVNCLFYRQGKKTRNVSYLNVLHILKEVHFRVMAISKLYQIFKFWLMGKGLN